MTTVGSLPVSRILDPTPPDGLDFVKSNSNLKVGSLIVSLIGSTVDLMMDFSLVCFVGILFNRLDFVSLGLDVTRIGILVGSTIDLVLNLWLSCFSRILFKVCCINPGIGR